MMRNVLAALLILFLATPAWAEDYNKPDWPNLLRTLVRFNAINTADDKTLDEYAAVSECDLFKSFFKDDFKWNQVRGAIRESIKQNIATFPTSYKYQTELQLDRYDFGEKVFRLTPKTTLKNVNSVWIYKVMGEPCEGSRVRLVPQAFHVVFDAPLFFDGIPLSQQDAEALLKHMIADKNNDRIVEAVLKIRIVYVAPMHLSNILNDPRGYTQNGNGMERTARLDARLDGIDFYEDAKLTKLIYSLQP